MITRRQGYSTPAFTSNPLCDESRRVDKSELPSYGFVQPKLEPVRDADGTIRDVSTYPH